VTERWGKAPVGVWNGSPHCHAAVVQASSRAGAVAPPWRDALACQEPKHSHPERRSCMELRDKLRVPSGKKVKLTAIDPAATPSARNKQSVQAALVKNVEKLRDLQYRLYAENQRSVLIVLQGMDSGGKDGTIRHVMTGLNPQGCSVTPFKVPSSEEADHDFLWRIHKAVPAKGDFGIFNRSHYEDVLVVRVHGLVPESVWSKRYEQINAFEKFLAENNVVIVKLFLHISKEEQLVRLKARIDDPTKHWKISSADFSERKYWDLYQAAYEDALSKCSTRAAPWYIIPADKKWYRNYAVSQVLVETLQGIDMRFPKPSIDIRRIRVE
jgi:PPK2 family polyphosphate:nucleotide phosphotransferase